MRNLLDGLMSLARLEKRDLRDSVRLEAVVEDVRGLLAGELLNRDAELRVEGPLPTVYGNRTRLLEVLSNLVSNGLKYNRSPRPTVVVRAAAAAEIDPEVLGEGEVCVAVRDNGVGIPAEYLEQVFEPFKRLHSSAEYEGTGIGLTIVRKAVRSMDGRIWVRSEVGRGTTFYVVLPGVLEG
jgi:signal transduction histidine kinase